MSELKWYGKTRQKIPRILRRVGKFENFCHLVSSYAEDESTKESDPDIPPFRISTPALAVAFVDGFLLRPPVTLIDTKSICDLMRIQLIAANTGDARGTHSLYDHHDATIFYRKDEWSGSQVFTILHELYEIMYYNLCTIAGMRRHNRNLEQEANLFAALVQAPPDWVSLWMEQKNVNPLDVVSLRQFLRCAYSTAIIRQADVLFQFAPFGYTYPTRMVTFLYERVLRKSYSCGEILPLGFTHFVQTKTIEFIGKEAAMGASLACDSKNISLKDLVRISDEKHRCFFIENVSLHFFERGDRVFNLDGFDVLVQPVLWRRYGVVGKVLVQAVPAGCPYLRGLAQSLKAVPHKPF